MSRPLTPPFSCADRQHKLRWPHSSAECTDSTADLWERLHDSLWIFLFYVVSSCFRPLVLCKIDFILHFCISRWLAAKPRWFIVFLIAPLPRSSWHSASFNIEYLFCFIVVVSLFKMISVFKIIGEIWHWTQLIAVLEETKAIKTALQCNSTNGTVHITQTF